MSAETVRATASINADDGRAPRNSSSLEAQHRTDASLSTTRWAERLRLTIALSILVFSGFLVSDVYEWIMRDPTSFVIFADSDQVRAERLIGRALVGVSVIVFVGYVVRIVDRMATPLGDLIRLEEARTKGGKSDDEDAAMATTVATLTTVNQSVTQNMKAVAEAMTAMSNAFKGKSDDSNSSPDNPPPE